MTVNIKSFMKGRDLAVAEMLRKREELGYFESSFVLHGTAYLSSEGVRYMVSDQAYVIYRKINELSAYENYATPICTVEKKIHVPLGGKKYYEQLFKEQHLIQLADIYPKEYFDLIRLYDLEVSELAKDKLDKLQDQLKGRFHWDYLQIFSGLIDLAYELKHLTFSTYKEYQYWVNIEKRQQFVCSNQRKRFQKTYYAFSWWTEGQMECARTFITATEDDVYRKRQELLSSGKIISPIFSKKYSYRDNDEMRKIRREFEGLYKSYIDADYRDLVQTFYDFPKALSVEKAKRCLEELHKQNFPQEAVEAGIQKIWELSGIS